MENRTVVKSTLAFFYKAMFTVYCILALIEAMRYISSGSEKPVQETPGVRRYLRDDKEQFYEWMINDRHMSERTCRSYISNIRGAERFAADHHYSHSSLYSVSPILWSVSLP